MSKTNDPLATRRLNNRPKASKVEVAKPVGVVSLGNARKQNTMDDACFKNSSHHNIIRQLTIASKTRRGRF